MLPVMKSNAPFSGRRVQDLSFLLSSTQLRVLEPHIALTFFVTILSTLLFIQHVPICIRADNITVSCCCLHRECIVLWARLALACNVHLKISSRGWTVMVAPGPCLIEVQRYISVWRCCPFLCVPHIDLPNTNKCWPCTRLVGRRSTAAFGVLRLERLWLNGRNRNIHTGYEYTSAYVFQGENDSVLRLCHSNTTAQ